MQYTYFLKIIFLISLCYNCDSPNQKFQLKEIPSAGSCFTYQILNAKNQPVELPNHIDESLNCPSMIDLTDGTLAYLDGNTIKLYRIKDGVNSEMFILHDGMDGISEPVWSEDRKRIMFVIINQERKHDYLTSTRIITLKLDNQLQVLSKLKFDRKVNFVCGGVCSSEPYEDFKYRGNRIEFRKSNASGKEVEDFGFVLLED